MSYDIFYSPDEGGWYAEIWDNETGKELYQTRLVDTKQQAKQLALSWIDNPVSTTGSSVLYKKTVKGWSWKLSTTQILK